MPGILTRQFVSDVERATELLPEVSPKTAVERLCGGSVEACSDYRGNVVGFRLHPFVAAVDAAFNDHRPLVLSPDMFWLLISQGLARCVRADPERLRPIFVMQETETIAISRDDFVKGSLENPWAEVFASFSAAIRKHIGVANHDRLVVTFSTTGIVERAANEVVLMDAMQSYFKYEFHTLCGIPEVMLEGTAADWALLPGRVDDLGQAYGLQWWTDQLAPALSRVAENVAGADDPDLWRNFYKLEETSGGPDITGWILNLFPFLQKEAHFDTKTGVQLDYLTAWQRRQQEGPDSVRAEMIDVPNRALLQSPIPKSAVITHFSGALSRVPFRWIFQGDSGSRELPMEFLAGFMGCNQDPGTFALRPRIGWAVRESVAAPATCD